MPTHSFPSAIRLSERCTVWLQSEVDQWIADQVRRHRSNLNGADDAPAAAPGAEEEPEAAETRPYRTPAPVEGFFSIFKRGMKGVYQHCAKKHLHRYAGEFEFRYNHRVALGFSDRDGAGRALEGIKGKRLTYRQSPSR